MYFFNETARPIAANAHAALRSSSSTALTFGLLVAVVEYTVARVITFAAIAPNCLLAAVISDDRLLSGA